MLPYKIKLNSGSSPMIVYSHMKKVLTKLKTNKPKKTTAFAKGETLARKNVFELQSCTCIVLQ